MNRFFYFVLTEPRVTSFDTKPPRGFLIFILIPIDLNFFSKLPTFILALIEKDDPAGALESLTSDRVLCVSAL